MNEYKKEFYRLNVRVNLQEIEIQLVSRYINGLHDHIKDDLSLHIVWTLSDTVNLALKVKTKQTKQFQKPTYFRKTYIKTQHSKTVSNTTLTPHTNYPIFLKTTEQPHSS